MKLTLRQLKDLYFEESDINDTNQFTKVDETEWVDNGKEQYGSMIIQDTVTKLFYQYPLCRSIGWNNATWYYERFDDLKEEFLMIREIEVNEVQLETYGRVRWTRVNK